MSASLHTILSSACKIERRRMQPAGKVGYEYKGWLDVLTI
jgi:hypothetical protein